MKRKPGAKKQSVRQKQLQKTRDTQKLMKLGLNVRWLRQSQGWTQLQLAKRANVDQTYISGIEMARRGGDPSLLILTRISHALGVPIGALCQNVDT